MKHELTGNIINGSCLSFDAYGCPIVFLKFDNCRNAMEMVDDLKDCEKLDIEISKHVEKRSLDANRYFWKLLGRLAETLNENKNELYLKYVQECGPFKDFVLTPQEAQTFRKAWSMLGLGWPTEQVDYDEDGERVIIRAYYGSSVYNTKQMSRLIDMVVQDAKSLGIETLPPEKLALLKENWHGCN